MGLATWSEWEPFAEGARTAPRLPGVYLIRQRGDSIRYAGIAGERSGNGLRGRLAKYRTGRAATSGFGEHAMADALADPGWVAQRLAHLESCGPERMTVWVQRAVDRLDPELCWAGVGSKGEAERLERAVVVILGPFGLWNHQRESRSD